jgi:hypothetical protein
MQHSLATFRAAGFENLREEGRLVKLILAQKPI